MKSVFLTAGFFLITLAASAQMPSLTQGETAEFSSLRILNEGTDGAMQSFSVSRDQKYIAIANERKVIKLFDGKTGKFFKRLQGYHARALEIVLMPGGERLLSVGSDKLIRNDRLEDRRRSQHVKAAERTALY